MQKKEIDIIVKNLIKKAGSTDIYDIISSEYITIKENIGKSFYCKIKDKKYIFIDKSLPEEIKPFVLGHELGHAILHDVEINHYTPLTITKSSTEREADYFSFKVLGKEIDPDLNYTATQYAQMLKVSEDTIKYICK